MRASEDRYQFSERGKGDFVIVLVLLLVIDPFSIASTSTSTSMSMKKPELLTQSGLFKVFTPQMPLRRISRSLSVTGGRPSQGRLTSN
ncbi:MAG TPA: hypothetical protein VNP98_17835 [Chthoniobacterales bacterium]|nr:hypothetical protein [Chthoniobacterales bacterium]